jgi:hypothetical protein
VAARDERVRKGLERAGEDELRLKAVAATFPEDWSPDQKIITVGHSTPGRGMGVSRYSLEILAGWTMIGVHVE